MTGDPHLRLVISHGFHDINIKSIMTVKVYVTVNGSNNRKLAAG